MGQEHPGLLEHSLHRRPQVLTSQILDLQPGPLELTAHPGLDLAHDCQFSGRCPGSRGAQDTMGVRDFTHTDGPDSSLERTPETLELYQLPEEDVEATS